MRFFLLIVFFCSTCALFAQPTASDSAGVYHEVEAGQTLFSIAKIYNVTLEQLAADNPGADTAIRAGQKIWVRSAVQKPLMRDVAKNTSVNGKHEVKAGETYYGISRMYGITVDELKALNNGMPAGLIAGDTIWVPLAKGRLPVQQVKPAMSAEEGFDIALMLPFYAASKDSLQARDLRLREAAVQIYRGVLAAADTLEKQGLIARIHVFDVIDNKNAIHALLARKDMQAVDLIIGPLFKDLIPEVAEWCKHHEAHMVVPVQQPNRILLNAPDLSKSVAGSVTQWMSMARYAHRNFAESNVVLIDSKIVDDRKLVESFKEEWARLAHDSLRKVVVCDDLTNLKVASMLPAGKCLVAVPSGDKKVIAAVFKAIGSRTDVDVMGMESWDDMDAISSDTRNRFHVTFPKQLFIDASDAYVEQWQNQYRRKYNSEPSDFSITGYDVMLYCGSALMVHGNQFPGNWSGVRANTIGTSFDFFKSTTDSGYENAAIQIIRTDNYQLTRVN
jgi:LysM repeat protein/ABC-type branched-subunit amino acid transport system substrate-binding protein